MKKTLFIAALLVGAFFGNAQIVTVGSGTQAQIDGITVQPNRFALGYNTTLSQFGFRDSASLWYWLITEADIDTFNELQAIVADETLAKAGDNVSIFANDAGYLTSFTETPQTLSFVNPNISISGGNSVDISAINTDSQSLSLVTNTLSLTNGGSVDLSGYLDNTDNQTLSFTNPNLSISDGNSIDISGVDTNTNIGNSNLNISGGSTRTLTLNNGTLDVLGINGGQVQFRGASNIGLQINGSLVQFPTTSPLVPDEAYGAGWNASTEVPTKNAVYDKIESIPPNTDSQTLSFVNPNLSISGGNSVDLSALGGGGGSGDVTKVGTPVNNQVGVWTGDGTIEGTSGLTYNGSSLGVTGNINATGIIDAGNGSFFRVNDAGSSYSATLQANAQNFNRPGPSYINATSLSGSLNYRTTNAAGSQVNRLEIPGGADNVDIRLPNGGLEIVSGDLNVNNGNIIVSGTVDGVDVSARDAIMLTSDTTGEPSGSDAVDNVVSLTQAEYDAGSPNAGTYYIITDAKKEEVISVAFSDLETDITTGTSKGYFRMPWAATLVDVKASFLTSGTGSTSTIDVNEAGTSVLSTKIQIASGDTTSEDAATQPVISDSSIANDAVITIDVDNVASGTAPTGGIVYLYFER